MVFRLWSYQRIHTWGWLSSVAGTSLGGQRQARLGQPESQKVVTVVSSQDPLDPTPGGVVYPGRVRCCEQELTAKKRAALNRLKTVGGHLDGIIRMLERCVLRGCAEADFSGAVLAGAGEPG